MPTQGSQRSSQGRRKGRVVLLSEKAPDIDGYMQAVKDVLPHKQLGDWAALVYEMSKKAGGDIDTFNTFLLTKFYPKERELFVGQPRREELEELLDAALPTGAAPRPAAGNAAAAKPAHRGEDAAAKLQRQIDAASKIARKFQQKFVEGASQEDGAQTQTQEDDAAAPAADDAAPSGKKQSSNAGVQTTTKFALVPVDDDADAAGEIPAERTGGQKAKRAEGSAGAAGTPNKRVKRASVRPRRMSGKKGEAPAAAVRVTCPRVPQCEGEFQLQPGLVNKMPWWKRAVPEIATDASLFLYSSPIGVWTITQNSDDFADGSGAVAAGGYHEASLPYGAQSRTRPWQCAVANEGWRADEAIRVVPVDDIDSSSSVDADEAEAPPPVRAAPASAAPTSTPAPTSAPTDAGLAALLPSPAFTAVTMDVLNSVATKGYIKRRGMGRLIRRICTDSAVGVASPAPEAWAALCRRMGCDPDQGVPVAQFQGYLSDPTSMDALRSTQASSSEGVVTQSDVSASVAPTPPVMQPTLTGPCGKCRACVNPRWKKKCEVLLQVQVSAERAHRARRAEDPIEDSDDDVEDVMRAAPIPPQNPPEMSIADGLTGVELPGAGRRRLARGDGQGRGSQWPAASQGYSPGVTLAEMVSSNRNRTQPPRALPSSMFNLF